MIAIIVTICSALSGQCEVHRLPAPSCVAGIVGAQAEIANAIPLRGDQTITSIECEEA